MSVDKGSRVAELASRHAQTSRCAGASLSSEVAAEHVHAELPVTHLYMAAPVNDEQDKRCKHAQGLLLILGLLAWLTGPGAGGLVHRARQHKLLLPEMSRDQEVCRLTLS
ncbi:hypothetical protein PBY51_018814 [Eleginops maclovinus]|uniref:Uncharacterized protein n=1 Tax=Eleginops maclovinus TaxID=56733 RepID=A0AAN8AXN5_ELEMC|nr:hypothetical protein PBY51_018814 [Eleginops maclovinus]